MFHVATENLHRAHAHCDSSIPKQLPHHFTTGDTVLIKNHTAGPFDSKYVGDYRIVSFRGNQVELIPSTGGKIKMEHISNIKYIMPAEQYISQLPDYEIFDWQTKLHLNPRNIPDLSWKRADTIHTQDISQATVSHIFHLEETLSLDDMNTILVNNEAYTQPHNDLCTMINACKTIVCSHETPCKILQAM